MQLTGTVLRAIEQVLAEARRKPADTALRQLLRPCALGSSDKRLISEAVFNYFRWSGWLDRTKALRGQLEHAFELAGNPTRIPDAELMARALPAWVHDAMEVSPALLRELQSTPRLWLRARPGTGSTLAARLGDAEPHATVPDALWYRGSEDLFHTSAFQSGEFEIQDLSSQLVGLRCSPQPGQTWWDACAGEGGKTLHLCDLMQNKGLVWASDTALWRLDMLKRRASRARVFNYRVKLWKTSEHLPTKTRFDGVLVDAPCSGIGTWGRNPHARWTTQLSDVTELAALQRSILNKVAGSVKPKGKLVYSVCTLTRVETTDIAETFEAEHPEFSRIDISLLRPEEWHSVGMFIAQWQRA